MRDVDYLRKFNHLSRVFIALVWLSLSACTEADLDFLVLNSVVELQVTHNCETTAKEKSPYSCSLKVDNNQIGLHQMKMTRLQSDDCPWLEVSGSAPDFILSGTPKNDHVGECHFKMQGKGGKSGLKFNEMGFTVSIANTPPSALTSGSILMNENDSAYIMNLDNSDEGSGTGSVGTYILDPSTTCSPPLVDISINPSSGELSVTPLLDQNGSCVIGVEFNDNNGSAPENGSYSLTITPGPSKPRIMGHNCSTSATEKNTYICIVTVGDVDPGDSATLDFATGNECDWVTIASSGPGSYSVGGTPDPGDAGSCKLKLKAKDTTWLESDPTTIDIAVDPAPPALTSLPTGAINIIQGSGRERIHDFNNDKMYTTDPPDFRLITPDSAPYCSSIAEYLEIGTNSGKVEFNPNQVFTGSCFIKVEVEDKYGLTDQHEFEVSVVANTAPFFSLACGDTYNKGEFFNCSITVNDADVTAGTLGATAELEFNNPTNTCEFLNLTGEPPTYTISGVIPAEYVGTGCSLGLRAFDQVPDESLGVLALTINNVNPTMTAQDVQINENATPTYINDLNASDEGLSGSSYALVSSDSSPDCQSKASFINVDVNNGKVVYGPSMGFTNFCYIKVQFEDGLGGLVADEFQVMVQPDRALKVEKVYTNSSWNDYIVNSQTNKPHYDQPDTDCATGVEGKGPDRCIHAGVIRKVVTSLPSCGSYSARDSQLAFNWVCDESGAKAVFYSVGFKPGKGLADLVNANGWKPMQVLLNNGSSDVDFTNFTPWWENPVMPLPPYNHELKTPGAVYTLFSQREDNGHVISADKISVVTGGNGLLKTSLSDHALDSEGNDYIWIEGHYEKANNVIISSTNGEFHHYRNIKVAGGPNSGVYVSGIKYSRFKNIRGADLKTDVLHLKASHKNYINEVFGTNIGQSALDLHGADYNVATQIFGINQDSSVMFSGYPHHNTATHISGHNQVYASAHFRYTAHDNLVSNSFSFNSKYGIYLGSGYNQVLYGIGAYNHTHAGVYLNTSGYNNAFKDYFYMSSQDSTASMCSVGSADLDDGLYPNTCTDTGSHLSSGYAELSTDSNAILIKTKDFSTTFLTSVNSDGNNTDNISGSNIYQNIDDWFKFDNPYRGWGKENSGLYHLATRGECRTENDICRIWDFAPKSGDIEILNVSGDGINQNQSFTPNSTCPSYLHGNKAISDLVEGDAKNTFVQHALEVLEDGLGDDDGLCESNETCFAAPNLGAYQGHGDLSESPCVFQPGTITNVKMHSHTSNGF